MSAAYSYNGWLASPDPADFGGLNNSPIPGTDVRLAPGVRAGDVAVVLFYVAEQLHKRVEPAGVGCWGFNFRPNVNDPSELSCHASATAFDWRAPDHPNGIKGTWTRAQKREVRKILAEVDNVVAWGEDFEHTTDGMHFEISGAAAEVARAADKIRALEDDFMAMTPAERKQLVDDISDAAARKVWAYGIPVDADTRKTYGYTKRQYAASALLRGADARGRASAKASEAARLAADASRTVVTALRSALGR